MICPCDWRFFIVEIFASHTEASKFFWCTAADFFEYTPNITGAFKTALVSYFRNSALGILNQKNACTADADRLQVLDNGLLHGMFEQCARIFF